MCFSKLQSNKTNWTIQIQNFMDIFLPLVDFGNVFGVQFSIGLCCLSLKSLLYQFDQPNISPLSINCSLPTHQRRSENHKPNYPSLRVKAGWVSSTLLLITYLRVRPRRAGKGVSFKTNLRATNKFFKCLNSWSEEGCSVSATKDVVKTLDWWRAHILIILRGHPPNVRGNGHKSTKLFCNFYTANNN